jgi:hypothetical protein
MKFYKYHEFVNEANINSVIDRVAKADDIEIDDMDSYIAHFIEMGAKRLSGGSSAEVLEMKNEVIKIYGAINDPGMTRYLSFCLENQRNPFVPKIYKVLKAWAKEEDRYIFAVFMENLKPSGKEFFNDLDMYLRTSLNKYKYGQHIKNDKRFFDKFKEIIMIHSKESDEKSLNDVINFLHGAITKYKYTVDFGPQNWMLRGSQLVLIDPFWPDLE